MKNSKEMADAVFRIRDEYIEKKHRRNEAVKKAAFFGVPACAAFVLIIGVGASFDRQEIGTDSTVSFETVIQTAKTTAPATVEERAEETNTLKDTAETSKATNIKKETKSGTLHDAEEASPETIIPEGEVPEAQPEVFTPPTVTEQMTDTTTVTTTAALSDSGIEGEVYRPDEETDAIPESTGTVNEAVTFTADQLCRQYPTLHIDREYNCTDETVTAEMLGDVMIETAVEGSAAYATVYSLDNGQIAVKFGETDFYIVYKAKEDQ